MASTLPGRNPFRLPLLVSITNWPLEEREHADALRLPSAKDIGLEELGVGADVQQALCREPVSWMVAEGEPGAESGAGDHRAGRESAEPELRPRAQSDKPLSVSFVQLSQEHANIAARKWEQRPWARLTFDSDLEEEEGEEEEGGREQLSSHDSARQLSFHIFSGRVSSQDGSSAGEPAYFEQSRHSDLFSSFLRVYERQHLLSCPSIVQVWLIYSMSNSMVHGSHCRFVCESCSIFSPAVPGAAPGRGNGLGISRHSFVHQPSSDMEHSSIPLTVVICQRSQAPEPAIDSNRLFLDQSPA